MNRFYCTKEQDHCDTLPYNGNVTIRTPESQVPLNFDSWNKIDKEMWDRLNAKTSYPKTKEEQVFFANLCDGQIGQLFDEIINLRNEINKLKADKERLLSDLISLNTELHTWRTGRQLQGVQEDAFYHGCMTGFAEARTKYQQKPLKVRASEFINQLSYAPQAFAADKEAFLQIVSVALMFTDVKDFSASQFFSKHLTLKGNLYIDLKSPFDQEWVDKVCTEALDYINITDD
jgi:hypothetical protein